MKTPTIIHLILAILLLGCLADMPYGYYQFVRFVAMVGFGVLAMLANDSGDKFHLILFVALALLFQPFFKVALGRELWNLVDMVVAGYMVLRIFRNK
ncbi:MAG: DUF6804 family protein [Bacteroidota bacterium]